MTNTQYTSNITVDLQNILFQFNNARINYPISSLENNWALIDTQNLHKAVKESGWKIDWKKLRQYLQKEYQVTKAVAFMGKVEKYGWIYDMLERAGFEIEFREVVLKEDDTIDGGNVDADLASYAMDHKNNYNKAVIIADDGDYCNTIKSLNRQNKLRKIISSHSMDKTSGLLKKAALESIISIESIRHIIEYKR